MSAWVQHRPVSPEEEEEADWQLELEAQVQSQTSPCCRFSEPLASYTPTAFSRRGSTAT